MSRSKLDKNASVADRDLYSGLIRLHLLHHAVEGPVFGLGLHIVRGISVVGVSPALLWVLRRAGCGAGFATGVGYCAGRGAGFASGTAWVPLRYFAACVLRALAGKEVSGDEVPKLADHHSADVFRLE